MTDPAPSSLQSLVPPSQQCEQAGEPARGSVTSLGQVWLGRVTAVTRLRSSWLDAQPGEAAARS